MTCPASFAGLVRWLVVLSVVLSACGPCAMPHIEHKRVRQDYSHRPVPSVLSEHQRQQQVDLAGREALASEPIEILSGQVGDQTAFVLAVRHDAGDQPL